MYFKYYQDYTGYVPEILPTLHPMCTRNTTKTITDMYLKFYQNYAGYLPEILPDFKGYVLQLLKHYTGFVVEILPTLHRICS